MAGIAISYRREDTAWITGRIFDRLKAHYDSVENENTGENPVVFLDYDATPVGADFREYIKGVLDHCDVLLAIIGPHWLGTDATGKPRVVHEDDWVRIEIDTALKKNIPVIPVLIDRTPIPSKDALPQDIQNLVYRQAAIIDTQLDFNSHMERLIRQIDRHVGKPIVTKPPPPQRAKRLPHGRPVQLLSSPTRLPKGLMFAAAAVLLCVLAAAVWYVIQGQKKSFPEPAYTEYRSPDHLGVTVVYPNNILTLDTRERQERRLSMRDPEGRPLVRVLRTALPDHNVKLGRQREEDELRRMDYTLTYIAPESDKNWSNWYVLSGVKHGTEFYFRRWYSDDSVVSLEFFYPKELAPLFDKLIPRMTHEFSFSSTSPKI
jgi:TIR domain-containing protein